VKNTAGSCITKTDQVTTQTKIDYSKKRAAPFSKNKTSSCTILVLSKLLKIQQLHTRGWHTNRYNAPTTPTFNYEYLSKHNSLLWQTPGAQLTLTIYWSPVNNAFFAATEHFNTPSVTAPYLGRSFGVATFSVSTPCVSQMVTSFRLFTPSSVSSTYCILSLSTRTSWLHRRLQKQRIYLLHI